MTMRMMPGEFESTNNHLLGTNQSSHRGGLGPQLGAGGNISLRYPAIKIRYDLTIKSESLLLCCASVRSADQGYQDAESAGDDLDEDGDDHICGDDA